jgi:DNA helicase HerA-like ATPase
MPPAPGPGAVPQREGARAGRVVSTAGSQVVILLDPDACAAGGIEMGSLVTLRGPHAVVYGLIEGLSTPMPLQQATGVEMKLAEIGLLGEVPDPVDGGRTSFRRGVSKLPSLDTVVTLADQNDTAIVYALPDRQAVRIGSVHQDPRVPAWVSVNDMLCKHFAILGTTGSGKSCGVTVLLKRILAQNQNGHVLLLDPHGEYSRAFGDGAEHLSVSNFRLPYWLLTFEELTEVVFGAEKADAAAEITHLRELVLAAKLAFKGNAADAGLITVDTPVPYLMGDLARLLERAMGALDNRANLPAHMRIKARVHLLQTDRRYAFLFDTGLAVRDNLAPVLSRLFRVPAHGKPLSILDLGSIPSELLSVVVAVTSRLAFDFAVWGGQKYPLLLVCEEAHRYAPQDTTQGFEPAKQALSRIAKEGRKYGISLGVISQRPSELASTILSQCNTVFAFRMTNERDQEIINATLAEASSALFSALPFLGNAEAIAIGEGVPVPMRLRFAPLPDNERPRSSSVSFTTCWQGAEDEAEAEMAQLVAALRGRRPA